MKKNILIIILFCISFYINAQQGNSQTFEISGKIIDNESKEPLEYATVVLTSLKSKKVTGGMTDSKGDFNFEVNEGNYDISIEFISFKSHKMPNKNINEKY